MSAKNRTAKASEALSDIEIDAVVSFLLYSLSMDQRRALMANLPLAYSKLFPGIGLAAVLKVASIEGEEEARARPY